jgi:hypothetical protein
MSARTARPISARFGTELERDWARALLLIAAQHSRSAAKVLVTLVGPPERRADTIHLVVTAKAATPPAAMSDAKEELA